MSTWMPDHLYPHESSLAYRPPTMASPPGRFPLVPAARPPRMGCRPSGPVVTT